MRYLWPDLPFLVPDWIGGRGEVEVRTLSWFSCADRVVRLASSRRGAGEWGIRNTHGPWHHCAKDRESSFFQTAFRGYSFRYQPELEPPLELPQSEEEEPLLESYDEELPLE